MKQFFFFPHIKPFFPNLSEQISMLFHLRFYRPNALTCSSNDWKEKEEIKHWTNKTVHSFSFVKKQSISVFVTTPFALIFFFDLDKTVIKFLFY